MGKNQKLPVGVRPAASPGRVRTDVWVEVTKKCVYGGTFPATPEGIGMAAKRAAELRAKYRKP